MGPFHPNVLTDQTGVTAIVVALVMVLFVGVAALALDIGHLYIVKNELQNAADAGCLAGARFLYINDGEDVNVGANEIAYQAAVANSSDVNPVEVHWSGGNTGDVVRGHWTFATRTFTPTDNDAYVALWDVLPEELDANPNFVNALRVRTRRENTPAASFFARIFGYENFLLSDEAIAYLGFAGTLGPGEVGQPLATCKESLLIDGKYSCSVGRMMTMGGMTPGQESGGWTDFNQDPYGSGPNPLTVASLVTQGQNPDSILLGLPMAVSGGDIPNAFDLLRARWEDVTGRDDPWGVTLPVIECPGNSLDDSERMVGAVQINILWVTGPNDDPTYSDAPQVMQYPHSSDEWSSGSSDGQVRWNSFVQSFNLKTIDGSFAPYQKKSIYYVPDCHHQTPRGRTGGENFGILAKIPVLAR
jgi:Flp pilus assembly protein TadG